MAEAKRDKRAINRLKAGASYLGCGRYLKWVGELNRQEIYTHYEFQRLERKYNDVMECYRTMAYENWNQLFFIYFLKYVGDKKNQPHYMSIARSVGYKSLAHERRYPHRTEALLLGASGLLKDYGEDSYTLELKREAEYMLRKYNITPLKSREWSLSVRPNNHPVLRLVQAAKLFSSEEFLFDRLLGCRTADDVEELFAIEASEYWTTHYVPAKVSANEVKRLGAEKGNVLGINVVVMLQYAYGVYTANEELISQAHNLIQELKPEYNSKINRWRNYGITPRTAFEGQALIEIYDEYCSQKRCEECHIGQRAMKDFSWLDDSE